MEALLVTCSIMGDDLLKKKTDKIRLNLRRPNQVVISGEFYKVAYR